ncbi:ABC-type Fe3+-hydroxamate transport system substrate-binding protein [Paenibacillus endophyticus]|uniref:ABC-type Fe3+-hydroxamate transport system substrate-binding protein n=1 Tax=Paenibacillus endophyticus TaxID=1294268 RepID=A0A7W5CDA8_9BACL|nr:ABC transporter substrate-binding protein [Paenibacillus endophyticus]MBB3155613.1 ABC-type Fe3+-hydroxamate transport system substrate-binding protein [Paenibacillus endophyticus]
MEQGWWQQASLEHFHVKVLFYQFVHQLLCQLEARELEKLEVWKAIPAVKQNHVYKISARHWMLNGPISDSMKIDDVLQALTGNKQ